VSVAADLEPAVLLQGLRAAYGLDLERVAFLGAGTAHNYRAESADGRFFVKLVPKGAYGAAMLPRVQSEAPLLRALRGVLGRVPRVVRTLEGEDLARIAEYPVLVHEWIDGHALGDAWDSALPELAELLGRLHAGTLCITAGLERLPVPPEDFALPFERTLLEDLDSLRALPRAARPALHALKDLLEPHQAALRALLERTRAFHRTALERAPAFVVCHTDAHGGNVMGDSDGALWIIDWETARLAPPEHDLWMLGSRLAAVLPRYEAGLGRAARLEPDVLGFYVCRRVLEDIAMDIGMIARENTRPQEDNNNLEVIQRYILPALHAVDQNLEDLRRATA
jgi:Ser/Thr protein kinase RdoA (MazF antagonist)